GLSKIVQVVVEGHSQTWTLVNTDFEQQIFGLVSIAKLAHRDSHSQRSSHRTIWRRERRHDGVADGFDHGASLSGQNLVKQAQVGAQEVIGGQIAETLVERSRTFEISKQKCKASDLQALVDIECVGPI